MLSPETLDQFHQGDPVLFKRLYHRHTPGLLDIARYLTHTEDDAQDVVLETWLRVFARRQTYTGEGSLRGWICAIGRAIGLDYYRSAKRRTQKLNLLEILQAADQALHEDPFDTSHEGQAKHVMAIGRVWATREELIDAILSLTPRQRDVVTLRFLAGRSTRDVARALSISDATVRSLAHQALRALQQREWAWEKHEE